MDPIETVISAIKSYVIASNEFYKELGLPDEYGFHVGHVKT